MVRMNFIFIFISSSDPNLLRKKTVKQKIKKQWPHLVNTRREQHLHPSAARMLQNIGQPLQVAQLPYGPTAGIVGHLSVADLHSQLAAAMHVTIR